MIMIDKKESPIAMCPVASQEFGQVISKDLSRSLRKYINKQDRADLSIKTGIGLSTVRDLIYRNRSLTENNCVALVAAIKLAAEKCKLIVENADHDELDLLDYIKQ